MPPVSANPLAWGLHPQAVELVEMRTAGAKHFRLPDGRRQAVISKYVHYQAAPGIWEETDFTLRLNGADHVVDRHDLNTLVDGSGIAVWERASGKGLRWMLPGPPAAVTGSRARYTGAGLAWDYTVRPSGLKAAARVASPLGAQTYSWRYQRLGNAVPLEADALGNLLSDGFTVPRAVIVGADRSRYVAGPWRALAGGMVAFDWDDRILPAEAYPYEIDPTTTFDVAASGDDGYVRGQGGSYPPTASSSDTTDTTLYCGRSYNGAGTYTVDVTLIRWNTATLPDNAVVSAATARLYMIAVDNQNARSLTAGYYSNWPIDIADYTSTAETGAHSGTALSALTGGYNNLALASLGSVSLTSYTGLRWHVSGGTPTGNNVAYIAAFDNASNKPQLVVTYTVPVNSPSLRRHPLARANGFM